MRKLLLVIFFLQVGFFVQAQYFLTGQDPASISWRQLHSPHFHLIYPDYYEIQAQKLAINLEEVYPFGSFSLKHKPQKIPVILHTQTVQSNGLVAWAPKRAEFYTIPHQSIYPQDWLKQLALHEFRHVVQVDKISSNLPQWIKALLGEQGAVLAFGAHLPWWFIEGDAVVTETALGNYGRGRLPSFLMDHRAQVVEKGVFMYDKAYLGSYRDFVPDHYKLGYYLVGNARYRYGSSLWEEVLTRIGKNPVSIFPFSKELKEQTGLSKEQLYYSIFDSLEMVWNNSDKLWEPAPFEVISTETQTYTNYKYNHWLNDSVFLSYKTSFDEIPSFIKTGKDGREVKFFSPGTIFDESVSYQGEWIIWSEQIPDIRWQHSGHSLIRLQNVRTGKKIEIKPEFKGFSPAISPAKSKIALVETDFTNNYYLSVYQLPEGKLVHRFQTPENNYLFTPEWINEKQIAVIILTDEGKRLAVVNVETNDMKFLTSPKLGNIKHQRSFEDDVYFIASYSGKDCLYRISLVDLNIERIFEPRFGVESPAVSPDGKSIVLSDYTANGFRLIVVPANHSDAIPLQEVKSAEYILAEALAEQEPGIPVFTKSESVQNQDFFPSEQFSKSNHLINFHSWAPVYIDPVEYEFYPGVSLMSQNLLGTSETILGYRWNLAENTGRIMAEYSFKGWYPMFDLELSYGPRAYDYPQIRQITNEQGDVISQDTLSQRFTWGHTNAGLNIRLPLVFGKGPYNRLFQPEIQYGFNFYGQNESTPDNFRGGSFNSIVYRLFYQQVRRQSFLDMYPNFGFILDGSFRHSPAGNLRAGQMMAFQSVLYLPGLMKNHGIKLFGGAQDKESHGTLGFSDVVRFARGWGRINTKAIYTGGADYKFPLLTPDWNFWGLLYVRRLKTSLFTDFSRLKGYFYQNGEITGSFTKDISSLGAEFTADVNIIRFYAPSTIGFRASYLPEMKNVYFDFLFSIDFNSF